MTSTQAIAEIQEYLAGRRSGVSFAAARVALEALQRRVYEPVVADSAALKRRQG